MKAECKSCDQEVFWAETLQGRPILLNSGKHVFGNMRVIGPRGPNDNTLVVEALPKSEIGQEPIVNEDRYLVHFATCPGSKQWSGRSRK